MSMFKARAQAPAALPQPLLSRVDAQVSPNYPGSTSQNVSDFEGNHMGMVFPRSYSIEGATGYRANDSEGAQVGLDSHANAESAIQSVISARNMTVLGNENLSAPHHALSHTQFAKVLGSTEDQGCYHP